MKAEGFPPRSAGGNDPSGEVAHHGGIAWDVGGGGQGGGAGVARLSFADVVKRRYRGASLIRKRTPLGCREAQVERVYGVCLYTHTHTHTHRQTDGHPASRRRLSPCKRPRTLLQP